MARYMDVESRKYDTDQGAWPLCTVDLRGDCNITPHRPLGLYREIPWKIIALSSSNTNSYHYIL